MADSVFRITGWAGIADGEHQHEIVHAARPPETMIGKRARWVNFSPCGSAPAPGQPAACPASWRCDRRLLPDSNQVHLPTHTEAGDGQIVEIQFRGNLRSAGYWTATIGGLFTILVHGDWSAFESLNDDCPFVTFG